MKLAAVVLSLALFSGCNGPVGTWCGTYQDRLYPSQPNLRFVAHFRFCEDGRATVDLSGSIPPNPATLEYGTWEKTTEGHAFTTHNALYPMFDYKLMGHWFQDGDEAEYNIWDRLYPTFTEYKARGTAERCEVDLPCGGTGQAPPRDLGRDIRPRPGRQ